MKLTERLARKLDLMHFKMIVRYYLFRLRVCNNAYIMVAKLGIRGIISYETAKVVLTYYNNKYIDLSDTMMEFVLNDVSKTEQVS